MTNRIHHTFLLLACTVFSLNALADTDTNDVFLHINGITACSFTVDEYDITDGEDYGGVTAGAEDGTCKITVTADRDSSEDVAEWFEEQIGTGNAVACDSSGPMPDKLNFAIEGSLQITQGDTTTTCDNILLAQGHIPLLFTYNWWLGSPDAKSGSVPYIGPLIMSCSSGGRIPKAVTMSPLQPCVNNFNLVIE